MSKRYVDTESWNDPWYQKLPMVYKCFWKYICDRCDCAGVWKVNQELAEFQIGAPVDWDNLLAAFKGRIVILSEEKWMVTKFVSFQYGALTEANRMHRGILRTLEVHGLAYPFDGALKGLQRGIEAPKDKDKDMDKDKDPYPYPHTPLVTEGDVFGFVEDDVVTEGICTEEGAREGETGAASGADPPKKNEAAVKHKHGQYGWVRLTGEEYNRLLAEFGNEVLRRYIAIVDEYAQTHGNAKKYKDWNLVVRKAIRERWGEKQNESKTSTVTGRKMYDRELRRIEELEREEALKRGKREEALKRGNG